MTDRPLLECTHHLGVPPDVFWRAMRDPTFLKAMSLALGATHCTISVIVNQEDSEGAWWATWTNVTRTPPPLGLGVVGVGEIVYTEKDTCILPEGPYLFECRNEGDDVFLTGEMSTEETEQGETLRTIVITQLTTRGMLASMLEGAILENLRKAYHESAEYLNRVLPTWQPRGGHW